MTDIIGHTEESLHLARDVVERFEPLRNPRGTGVCAGQRPVETPEFAAMPL